MKNVLVVLATTVCLIQAALSAETMSVQVKKSFLKGTPSFLGKNITTLYYADQVKFISKREAWMQVSKDKKKGWLHGSVLTDKKIVLNRGSSKAISGVSSDEIILAGKGFNSQVEKKYRQSNPKLRFDLVDKMERYTVPLEIERAFAKNGKLNF